MKFTLMSYHYLRYPIRKYLDKMERVAWMESISIAPAPSLTHLIILWVR